VTGVLQLVMIAAFVVGATVVVAFVFSRPR